VQAKAELLQIDSMVRFDETIKKVFQHCRQVLEVPGRGARELARQVEKQVLDKNAQPSALLKFYFQLS